METRAEVKTSVEGNVTETCQARTRGQPPFYRGGPCGKRAARDGFCRIHHPEAVAKRKAERSKKGDEKLERWRREHDFRTKRPADYREALAMIAAGAGDARVIARDALNRWGELAQGIEAQSATTEGRGPKDESPVAKRCAQIQSPISGGG